MTGAPPVWHIQFPQEALRTFRAVVKRVINATRLRANAQPTSFVSTR
jgi:hypothetical protein